MERSFPVILCELRKEKGISQKDAAAALDVSQALLSHYEKGIRECGQDFLIRAADYYHVTCDYLLGRSTSKTGVGEFFGSYGDIPEDANFGESTLLRTAFYICSKLATAEMPIGIDYQSYIGIELYRIIMNLVFCGVIPRKWLSINDTMEYLNPISLNIINASCDAVLSCSKNKSDSELDDRDEQAPLCVKTVGKAADDLLIRIVAQATPPIPEKYQK